MLTAIPALGIQGAAWATLADIGIAATLNLYFVYRYTGFFLDGGDLLKNSLAALLMGGVMYFGYGAYHIHIGNSMDCHLCRLFCVAVLPMVRLCWQPEELISEILQEYLF